MKKLLTYVILIALTMPIFITGCSNNSTKIKLNEVTHSIFYAPLYIAINKAQVILGGGLWRLN